MITNYHNQFSTASAQRIHGIAIIAAFGTAFSFGVMVTAHADAPTAPATNPGLGTVHRMVLTPTWTTTAGSAPTVSGITVHATSRHAAVKQVLPPAKIHFNDFIDEPIWPVTPPAPTPTEPTDPGTGTGSGG